MLLAIVVVAGMASLALEMAASRLLAPFFGTSLYSWAILIGLILTYLTAGYWLGGRVADRYPRWSLFLTVNVVAALAMALVGLLATPVLGGLLSATATLPQGLFAGTVAGCLALFAVPTVLLGSVNPFAIRLRVSGVSDSGSAAGMVFGLTTIGSLAGTFLAVFLLIPALGTRMTLYVFAALLLGASAAGSLVRQRSAGGPSPQPESDQLLR